MAARADDAGADRPPARDDDQIDVQPVRSFGAKLEAALLTIDTGAEGRSGSGQRTCGGNAWNEAQVSPTFNSATAPSASDCCAALTRTHTTDRSSCGVLLLCDLDLPAREHAPRSLSHEPPLLFFQSF